MDFDVLGDLNWLAVIVAAIAYFVLGGIWYSPPVLGKQWTRASGFQQPQDGQSPGAGIYVAPLIGDLIAAIAVGMVAAASSTDTFTEGLVLGLVIGIGVAGVIIGTTAVFESNKPEPITWFWITAAYHLVGFILMSVILASWT
jgi:Protein of unknown function (DUF1761)